MRPRALFPWAVVLVVFVLAAGTASAQDFDLHFLGVRGGFSQNPDQFHAGVFAHAGWLTSHVRLQPSVELGVGNGVLLGALNGDALYVFSPRRFRPYAGGGLGINFIDITNGVGQDRGVDIEPVVNLVGGVQWGTTGSSSKATERYLLEARFGLGNTPELKISAGITF